MTDKLATSLKGMLPESKDEMHAARGQTGGPQMCGDIDMRIARDGTWHYLGSPIGRQKLVKLFASVLQRDAAGDYWLVTPAEMCRIQVDDAPFVAVEMMVEGSGRNQVLHFRTNLDEMVTADAEHPLRVHIDPETGEPSPYVLVRGGLQALIARSVFYEIVDLGEAVEGPHGERLGIWSSGQFFEIGELADA